MSDEDLKSVISIYQQKSFELFNQNIVFEAQINSLKATVESLTLENKKLKAPKKSIKSDDDFT